MPYETNLARCNSQLRLGAGLTIGLNGLPFDKGA